MNEWEWQALEDKTLVDHIMIGETEVRVGDGVRLRPRKSGDILDIALAGQSALIESIEQDYEGKIHICVVLDEDPGKDMGMLRQPGHRFFFDSEEIEPLPPRQNLPRQTAAKARILIAGVGNIFMGDDGFGVEVVKRLVDRGLPEGVRIIDFGIRGFDLAYALQDGYEATILIDAYPHGQQSGTISLVEPDLTGLNESQGGVAEPHGMNPIRVLQMATAMNSNLKNVLLVGCEPSTLGGEEGQMGLSEVVEGAVDEAVELVISAVNKILGRQ